MKSFVEEIVMILIACAVAVTISLPFYFYGYKSGIEKMRSLLVNKGLAEYRLEKASDSTVQFIILSPEEIAKKVEAK